MELTKGVVVGVVVGVENAEILEWARFFFARVIRYLPRLPTYQAPR